MDNLNNLEAALAILSAMLTPAVLISACGALTISTSNRLGRTLDQTRKISEQLESLVSHPLLDSMLAKNGPPCCLTNCIELPTEHVFCTGH